MAQTQQGAFEMTYHHIDAPTRADDEWGKEHKSRRLIRPSEVDEMARVECYRDPLSCQLSKTGWQYKRKLDGQNMRVFWDGDQALWNGKSDKFTCNSVLTKYMNETFLEEIFEEKFDRNIKVVLFGEHMGPGVQGNELKLKTSEFVLYDVNINDYWQSPKNIQEIAGYFGIKTCYDYMPEMPDCDTLDSLIDRVSTGEFKDWEGIVATPAIECKNQRGDRMIVKIKNRDYLPDQYS